MSVGNMRHRVALQEVTNTVDGGGGNVDTWATTKTVWAEVKPISGAESFRAMQMEDSITHRITIRYDSGIVPTPKWRVKLGSRVFNIRSVINIDERNEFRVLVCTEGVGT